MYVAPVRFLVHQQRTYVKNRGATVEDELHLLGSPLGLPRPATIAIAAHQLLLLGLDRDHRLPLPLEGLDPPVDVLELGIPVGVVLALRAYAPLCLRDFRDLGQYTQQVLVFPPRPEAATVDALAFAVFLGLEETQRQLAEPCQVRRTVARPVPLIVLAEADVQDPV